MHKKYELKLFEIERDAEYELQFLCNDEILNKKIEYSIEDALIDSCEFLQENCENYNVDTRFDTLIVNIIAEF